MTPAPLFSALCLALGALFGVVLDMAVVGAVLLVVGGFWLGTYLEERER